VAQRLRELGFGEVYALTGGMDAWRKAGLPDEAKHEDAHPSEGA